jgi:hypothetical protein
MLKVRGLIILCFANLGFCFIDKVGVLPQLGSWNSGMLEKWVLGYWSFGLMVRQRRNDIIRIG